MLTRDCAPGARSCSCFTAGHNGTPVPGSAGMLLGSARADGSRKGGSGTVAAGGSLGISGGVLTTEPVPTIGWEAFSGGSAVAAGLAGEVVCEELWFCAGSVGFCNGDSLGATSSEVSGFDEIAAATEDSTWVG